MTILEEIAARTRVRVAKAKETAPLPPPPVKPPGEGGSGPLPFERALSGPGLSFICEVKKASPSRGIIAEDFPYARIAADYEEAGAAAVSVLTEPDYFLGDPRHLREIAGEVTIPVLRKDFIVDPYQIYEAGLLGASAVLLIAALLDRETLAAYIKTAGDAGLAALVEVHREAEVEEALEAGARIIGVNNRDLRTFTVDTGVTGRLRRLIPPGVLTVAESGVTSPGDVRVIADAGVDAALVGESLMRAPDRKRFLAELRAAGGNPGRG
ncbi:MAG: indole-3-glycerol phosphate synthase TrpC [Treponema sp.]|jgi:indole-3-glycerol phosphate synthase|nr:indole-3-glycerol phosphate synthase TrpC [Treponema sp.]